MDLNKRDSASSGAVYQYVSQVVFLLSGLAFYAFLMHQLASSFVGEVVLISTLVQIFSGVLSLNLQYAFAHFISYSIDDTDASAHIARKFLLVSLFLSILSFPIFYLIAPLFSVILFHTSAEVHILRFSSIYLSLSVASGLISGILYGFQRFRKVNVERAVSSIIGYALAGIIAVVFGSIIGVIIALSIGQIYFISLLLYRNPAFQRLRHKTSSPVKMGQVVAYSLPVILTVFVGNSANHLDKLVAAAFMSVSSVGVYNLSLMVAAGLYGAIQSINQILLPKMSEIFASHNISALNDMADRSVRMLTFIFVPASLGLVAISTQVTIFIGGGGYLDAVFPLRLILFIAALSCPVIVISVIPSAIRKTKISYLVAPVSFATNLGLSLVLIPRFGIDGAAIGFAALYPLRFAILYFYSVRWISLKIRILPLVKTWLASTGMLVIVWTIGYTSGFQPVSLVYLVPLGTAFYFIFARAMKILRHDDIDMFLDMIPVRLKVFRKILASLSG